MSVFPNIGFESNPSESSCQLIALQEVANSHEFEVTVDNDTIIGIVLLNLVYNSAVTHRSTGL